MNKAFITAGRYMKSGPQFFYDMPIIQAFRLIKDAVDSAKQEERMRKKG